MSILLWSHTASSESIANSSSGIDFFSTNELLFATNALAGLDIIFERLKTRKPKPKKKASINDFVAMLDFAQEYYVLRDYIYYSFANKESISWKKKGKINLEEY